MYHLSPVPSRATPARRDYFFAAHIISALLVLSILADTAAVAQSSQFVARSGEKLLLEGRPFYFLGANAYYLMETAAQGDTPTVKAVFETAQALGLNVIRTWAFFDSPDSLNPAVVQYRPGAFNELALRALDYVVREAKRHNVRLLLPLVNSWDDYGGMNQYVRWRSRYTILKTGNPTVHLSNQELARVVSGPRGQSYRVHISPALGHDDFYSDSTIVRWYKEYISAIVHRANTFTGILYRDEPAIFGWELANEPRSSDGSGRAVTRWVEEISRFVKSIDQNHLLGTGEEGFDILATGYTTGEYNGQSWLFDGSSGVSYSRNSAVVSVDYASIHLYPESWRFANGAGNTWIRDHLGLARTLGKPLVMGEFGVRDLKAATYDSWLATVLLEDAAGSLVWQLLGGPRNDPEGFGLRCPGEEAACSLLRIYTAQFAAKSQGMLVLPPPSYLLYQNYPNPCNAQTTVAYDLPVTSYVTLVVYNILGQNLGKVVDGVQRAGTRKELLDVSTLASGAYFYRLAIESVVSPGAQRNFHTRKLVVIR